MNKTDLPPLALIAGPTASGKSALAMALAGLVPSIIINADAMQVYRDLRIVTARPSVVDEARHRHALFGDRDGAEACSAAAWAAAAAAAVAKAHRDKVLPIVVGGSGLYIRTLLDGIAPLPPIDADVRTQVRALPVADAHAALTAEDPAAAARLAPADTTRVARALEVVRSTGRPIADWHCAPRTGGIADSVRLVPLILDPPRDALATRIAERFAAIVDAGRDEVAALIDRVLDPALPVMRAIGVAAIGELIAARTTRDATIAAGTLATRQYAKRQATWFSRQAPPDWPRCSEQLTEYQTTSCATLLHKRLLT